MDIHHYGGGICHLCGGSFDIRIEGEKPSQITLVCMEEGGSLWPVCMVCAPDAYNELFARAPGWEWKYEPAITRTTA